MKSLGTIALKKAKECIQQENFDEAINEALFMYQTELKAYNKVLCFKKTINEKHDLYPKLDLKEKIMQTDLELLSNCIIQLKFAKKLKLVNEKKENSSQIEKIIIAVQNLLDKKNDELNLNLATYGIMEKMLYSFENYLPQINGGNK